MSSTGRLFFGSGGTVPVHTYSGTTTLSGGVTLVSGNNLGTGNLVINGGVVEDYYRTNFVRGLGTGSGQVQITDGASGFGNNNGGSSVIFGNNASNEAVWGSAVFKPSTLVLQTQYSQGANSLNFQNKIDLNGGNRTILANSGNAGTSISIISGVIRNTAVVPAGLIKTGAGILILTAANTYDGGTTINQGNLRFNSLTAMPPAGNVTVNNGATLTLETGAAGDWTSGTSGVGTLGGLFAGVGSAGTSTVSFVGDAILALEMTGNLTYAGDIPNLGTNLSITKTGGSSLILTGNNSYSGKTRVQNGTLGFNTIGNVGAGASALGSPATAALGTIDLGSGATTAALYYTGAGHTSDRVIRLSGSTGGATIDASGVGNLTLTSSLTAAAGAKTLTLSGSNTGNNSLAATTLASLTEVFTVTKSGAGTWLINGFSSPKNAWTVSAGTLIVNAGITTGDQNFTVSDGTLAGNGPITLQSSKTLFVQAAGSLAPGHTSVGTLAVTGKLDLAGMANGSGKLNFQMGPPASSDKIAVTGTAQIGSGLLGLNDFVFTDLGGMTSSTYTLISTTGGITGTLDPANRSGSIGSIAGSLQINGNNLEFTVDSDLDGMPDSYELANTNPPSATGLDPNGDVLLDNDGLTTLQEYLIGTNPNNPDTDGDSLLDGVETRTGIWVSGSDTGTFPLIFDTDGDTIRDGYETNTGIFASATNIGTNPNIVDSDSDSLRDNVETGTGTHVSRTNTGTNPNLPDTDSDGAGDWYEVAIIDKNPALGPLPNSPNDAALKPNIPYPLPDPDASTGATDKPVKVYIMSGQSNMVGIGYINGGAGSLDTIAKTEKKFPNLVNGSNAYNARNDVRYRGVVTAIGNGLLAPGQGGSASQLGPELGFGHVMGYHHDEPVLLLKSSEGNRSLNWDILPPGSPSYAHTDGKTYAGYGQSPESWTTAGGSPSPFIWYAGKQYDDFFRAESDFGPGGWTAGIAYVASGALGSQVVHNGVGYVCKAAHTSNAATEPGVGAQWASFWNVYSITNVVDVLDNFAAQYPQWASQGFEIAGFVWWQGHKDQGQPSATRYESGMVNLINSLRSYYGNRYPGKGAATAPFVLGTIGFGGWTLAGDGLQVANAQLAVSDPVKYPAYAGNVKTIETRSFWREANESPGTQGFHYNNNAETYMLTGEALGRAMIDLKTIITPGTDFANWMNSFGVAPGLAGFSQDADGDGIDNGVENFFGTNPSSGSAGLVGGATSSNTFVFTHPQNATPASGVTAVYRWSKDLATFRSGGQSDGGTTVNFSTVTAGGITTVTATITGTPTAKLFVDVQAIQN